MRLSRQICAQPILDIGEIDATDTIRGLTLELGHDFAGVIGPRTGGIEALSGPGKAAGIFMAPNHRRIPVAAIRTFHLLTWGPRAGFIPHH